MSELKNASVFFTDGYVVSKSYVLVAAKLNESPEAYYSRCFYFRNENWIHGDIKDAVHSVSYDNCSDAAIWLGRAGTITSTHPGNRHAETLADVARLGNVNRVRNIAGNFYICGYGGQVYHRVDGHWVHFDTGLLVSRPNATSVDLLDIDGSGPNDIYAVGTGGAIFHYDGSQWSSIDSPTNVHLTGVKCVNMDEVYICGFHGTILRGNHLGWEVLSSNDEVSNFYSLEYYANAVYLASATKLVKLVRDKLAVIVIDIDIGDALTFHRLHANDGVLWSFGTDHLLFFDGVQWRQVVHPDNTEFRE
jgi:hypothetical protein